MFCASVCQGDLCAFSGGRNDWNKIRMPKNSMEVLEPEFFNFFASPLFPVELDYQGHKVKIVKKLIYVKDLVVVGLLRVKYFGVTLAGEGKLHTQNNKLLSSKHQMPDDVCFRKSAPGLNVPMTPQSFVSLQNIDMSYQE